jgi:hypothetical protein
MIQQKTSSIMLGGIKKYSEIYQEDIKNVQIRVTDLEGDALKYEICNNWQPLEEISFLDILNKKMDILGYESLATPFLKKSLELYSRMFELDIKEISVFIFHQNNKVGIAVFQKFKNLKVLSLEKHFEQMGV